MLQEGELVCETCFEQRKHIVSGSICHLYKLDGDGSVSYVAPKQKDRKGCGIGNKFFQDRSSLMESHHLVLCPCKLSCTDFAYSLSSTDLSTTEDISFWES